MGVILTATGPITPDVILGYQSTREAGNRVHLIPSRSNPDITLRPAGLRVGTLHLGFLDETASQEAEQAHVNGAAFVLLAPERESVEMSYIVSGRIERELEDATRRRWIVRVDYQEIDPT